MADKWIRHPDKSVDLCALPFASVWPGLGSSGVQPFYQSFINSLIPTEETIQQLTAVEDILMVGYPDGRWDEVNGLPLVRRGITASDPRIDFGGLPEFATDIACFAGSSGSPILLFNAHGYIQRPNMSFVPGERILLLGVHVEGDEITVDGEIVSVKTATSKKKAQVSFPMNLGLAIKARQLLAFDRIVGGS